MAIRETELSLTQKDVGTELSDKDKKIDKTNLHEQKISRINDILSDSKRFDKILKNILKPIIPIILIVAYFWLFDKTEIKNHAHKLWEMNVIGGFIGAFGSWLYGKKK
jgi:hypothetical protein